MRSNTYTAFLGFIFFTLLNFIGLSNVHSQEEGDIFDLRFLTELDCSEDILTANIQIRTQEDTFKIGISSVLFNYDETVLAFLDYESLNFDQSNVCIPGVPLAVWDNHQFSSTTPGVFNLTLLTEIASQSCPIIERDWIDIGKVRFTVKNMEASPNMQFDARNTTFNRNDPNDGTFAPTQGDLMGFNELLTSQCVAVCSAPTLSTDTLTFECPQTTIEANLLANDITNNPTISILNNPTKGTASINPNGMLTYTPTATFCGEDFLTYRVCNDGSADCCSEATVSISLIDSTLPVFVAAPADLTIECNQLTEMEDIQATDNCAIANITKSERIEAGSCPGDATHIRTWTAVDVCGNQATHTQIIALIDNEEPTIECPRTVSILCSDIGEGAIDSGQPTASDNCTPRDDLKVSFTDEVISENCENFIQKQIARTWTVVDACGNFTTCIQTINVIDDIAPEINCPNDITINCGNAIAPDTLGSQPTAMDNCSAVTMSFVDDESMPDDCNFDTKIITRTWTATDACGNSTNCTQTITISGDPCPTPTTKDLTVYKCEQDIVDFKAILVEANDVIISISNSSDIPAVTDIQQYALPATGCAVGEFRFAYNIYTLEEECLIESGILTIKTIPNFIGETVLSEDGCTANLILECPELYTVTWNTSSDSGTGTSYTATPGTSGEVVFSVIYTADTLPNETASLPCVEKLYRVNFNCGTDCPTVANHEVSLTTCAGQNFDIAETLNLFEDSLDYTFTLADSILGIEFGVVPSKVEVGNPFGCEMGTFNLIANGYDANQCLVKSINIVAQVLPKIEAFFQYETDSTFCAPKLILECPTLYSIEWKDNLGGTGIGDTYTGANGTGGFVTFYVYPIDENLIELPCAVDSFFADFSCGTDCPQPIERQERLTVCAESEVNIIDLLGLSENKRNTFDSDEIVDGIYKVGNPFGCELGTKAFSLKCFDENQCLVEIITLNIVVIPAIYGEVIRTADVACGLFLNLECPENHFISWEDSNGNSGNGAAYTGPANTVGTVKFTVEYLTELPILSIDSLGCFSQTFEADYNCTIDCPDVSTEERTMTVCSGETLNIPDYLDLGTNEEYLISGIELDAINNYQFFNEACGIKESTFTAELFDGDCLIKVISVTARIIPKINGEIQSISDDPTCTLKLLLDCEDAYEVKWSDDRGHSGNGNVYHAISRTSGVVTFQVVPFDTLNGMFCGENTFSATFDCTTDCPVIPIRRKSVTICSGESLNMPTFLDLSPTFRYQIVNNFEADEDDNIKFTNAECGAKEATFTVNIIDGSCLAAVVGVTVNILPKVEGIIQYGADSSFCTPKLLLSCEDGYQVDWSDNLGNTGTGNIYEASAGTTGFVTFYVTPLDTLNEIYCVPDTFIADFNCGGDCPVVSTEERTITVCNGESLHFIDYLNLDINGVYLINGARLEPGNNNIFINETCRTHDNTFIIELFDGACLIKVINVTVSILPKFTGTIQYLSSSSFCTPKLILSCEDNYQVTWSDNLGNIGTGNIYEATEGTTGFVTFYVTPFDTLNGVHCVQDTFLADFNCGGDCPGVFTEERTITVCSGETLNISDYLDFSLNSEYFVNGIELDANNNYKFVNEACEIKGKTFTVELFDGECLIKVISVTANILPDLIGNIQYLSDSTLCTLKLLLSCEDNYEVTWSDNLGNTGTGNIYEATEGTSGFVTFYVTPFDTLNELLCVQDTFFADFNCRGQIIDCPIPAFETIDLYGCEGEIFNLFNRLQFSENTLYRIADGDGIEDIKNIRLENAGTDCFISQSRLAIDVLDELGCVTKSIFVSFNVLPKIVGELTNNEEDCGVDLTLTCPNIYAVSWVDDLGNTGEGFSYKSELGTTGLVSFTVSYKDSSLANQFIDSTCYIATFQQDFACCKPAGTACDDGDALTFNDVEDGNCACFGTGCNLEHKGKIIDGSELAGCSLLIEMSDGTILEPHILPVGETLSVGQEIIFSFVELSDAVSICQRGKIVQIICLENTCPEAGTPCSDNNLATINDEQDGNCNCVGEAVPEIISEIDLRLRAELDCRANTYCLTLQAKAQREDVTIGTSSIMVNYDPDALEFASYVSTQFDEKETCIGGTTSPWDEQKIDGTSVPGKFCLTMTLLTDSISCPEITTQEWEDIGIICFDIMNNDTTPNIRFDSLNTHFNSSSPNDGTRPIAIGTLHGIDTDEALGCEGNTLVATNELALKAMLQGPYKANKQLMTDDLRKRGFIPLTEPYTGIPSFVHFGEGGGEAMTLGVLGDNGDNAIVDWVFLELRSDVDSTLIVATRSALIQRDGDVVDVDGESNVQFVVPDGDYYVCLKHRNHLGVMTAAPVTFISAQTTEIDFTTAETLTYGNHALLEVQDKMVLRGGNANPDRFIILAGGGLGLPDRDMIFFDIFLSLWQTDASIPITYNSVLHGYYGSDTNMDGKVKYQGPKNDIDAYIFFNVLFHPQNTSYRLNFAISEQIP